MRLKPLPPPPAAFTWVELLVALSIVFFLFAVGLALVFQPKPMNQKVKMLSNMRQLYLATETMALDGTTTSNAALGWPGDTGGTFSNWARQLVDGDYLTPDDLAKLLSTPDLRTPRGRLPQSNDHAVLAYAVRDASPGNTIFLTSVNFTNTPAGGLAPGTNRPFGQSGFVIFHKAGDGTILAQRQAGDTNAVGDFVPLLK